MVFNLINVLLAGGSYFTFLFFLRAVAASVRSPGLALSVLILIIASGVAVLMNLGSWVLSFFVNVGQNLMDSQGMMAGGAGLVGACGCCGDFIWIANAVWLIVTLFLVRAAITRYVEGRA
jgi:hypothetical protein